MCSLLIFIIHYWLFCFRHHDVVMYYCSCLHNWQWGSTGNRWLVSPQITHQKLALKQLPHRKCMAKLWNVIPPLPYFQMKCFSEILAGWDELQNEPNLKSVRYCIGELLYVFDYSAQHERIIMYVTVTYIHT